MQALAYLFFPVEAVKTNKVLDQILFNNLPCVLRRVCQHIGVGLLGRDGSDSGNEISFERYKFVESRTQLRAHDVLNIQHDLMQYLVCAGQIWVGFDELRFQRDGHLEGGLDCNRNTDKVFRLVAITITE